MATTIVEKCIYWHVSTKNDNRQYNFDVSLLQEQVDKLNDSPDILTTLEAIGDICFVSIGLLYKAGVKQKTLNKYINYFTLYVMAANESELYKLIRFPSRPEDKDTLTEFKTHMLKDIANKPDALKEDTDTANIAISAIIMKAASEIRKYGLGEYFYCIVDCICNSKINESQWSFNRHSYAHESRFAKEGLLSIIKLTNPKIN